MEDDSDDNREAETFPSAATAIVLGAGHSLANGRYLLKRLLGEGGQKLVYLARDERLDRDVVVAILKTESLDQPSVARLWREAKTLAKLGSHPNIITIFDVGEEQGRPYVVSEYVEGGSIESLLRNADHKPLPLDQAIVFAQHVGQALFHAHGRGVVHRDVKPGNVLLTETGIAKLGDFGLAVGLNVPQITLEGQLVGTVAYMSPEQALGKPTDQSTDVYSLGAMVYQMVTGQLPFPGDNLLSIVTQHVTTPPVAPSLLNPAVPAALENLILRLLAKVPFDRPDSATVLQELSAIRTTPEAPVTRTVADEKSLARLAGGVFVGRDQEMRQLRAALYDAMSGTGRLLLLVGEAGSGKTRLAEQLATYARMRDAQVLIGRCYEGQGVPAYWPWVQIVRGYVQSSAAPQWKTNMGSGAADIAQVVSQVRDALPDLPIPPSLEPGQARFRLFDSMTSFLKNAAKSRPLVIVLDDLHWADAPSLMLLQFLVREMQEARLLVVGTYRDTELGRHHPLAQTVAEVARHSHASRINISGLPHTQVARFIELTAGISPSTTLVDAVYHATEGNPFFVNEVVKLLVEDGRLKPGREERAVRIPVPQSVREVIGRRLDHLSEACNRVLTIASVAGREFDIRILEPLCDVSTDRLVELLEEAVSARVITETGGMGQYTYVHALIRETLYNELSGTRRMRLHKRIGEVLESMYAKNPDPHVAQLAYHFLQAAGAGDLEKAIGYSVKAAERANALLAYEESAGFYEHALNALALRDEASEERRCNLLIGLADAQTKAGNVVKAWETFQQAAGIARRLGAAEQFARAALGSGSWAMGLRYGHVDHEQIALLDEALTMQSESDSPLRAKLLAQLALACYHVPGARRLELSERALEMAHRSGDSGAQLAALFSRSMALEGYEKAAERLEVASEIVAIAERLGSKEMSLRGHFRRLRELLEFGDVPSVDDEIETYSRLADELRQPVSLWLTPFFKASRAMLEGRFDECESLLDQSLKIGQRAQDQNAVLFYATNMTTMRRLQGRFDEVAPKVKRFVEQYPSIVGWRATLAQIYTELGQRDDARAELDTLAVHDFADVPRDGAWVVSMCLLAQVCAYLRDAVRAGVLYDILVPFKDRNIVIGSAAAFYGPVSRHLGLLAATMSRWDDAAAHFEDCLTSCEKMAARPFEAYTQCDYGAMLLARGRPDDGARARDLLDRAHATATELGMARIVADVESLVPHR